MDMERLAFIGAGNMAGAILEGILKSGILPPDAVCMADVSAEQRADRAHRFGVRTTADNAEAVRGAASVILAVKPQQLDEALASALPAFTAGQLVVSICAGVTTARLEAALPGRVVRVMPNLPALAGAGVAAVCPGSRATSADLDAVCALLAGTGTVVRVGESQMDAVTGLSGSGPGYAFAFIEALEAAGLEQGFSPETARMMAIGTVLGAAKLAAAGDVPPAEWRRRVSSKGGTTLAGLAAMESLGFTDAVKAAVRAATARSAELAGGTR
jgi:pyrroline-5-carboxylate reductase